MIDLKDLLQMYFERSTAVQTFWNFEIVIIVGVLTIICTARTAFTRVFTRLVVMGGFFVLAVSNLDAVLQVNRQRRILHSEIAVLVAGHPHWDKLALPSVTKPPSDMQAILYHLFFDALILGLIWLIPTIEDSPMILRVNTFFIGLKQRYLGEKNANK